jgi:voltage-gated potassium channel Kch
VIAVVAFALGYIGLSDFLSHQKTPQFGQGWADIVYYDVQLFVLNSAPAQSAGPFPVALGIARFLAPAATAVATVEAVRLLLSEQIRRWSAAWASKHAVVTGDGAIATGLARKLCADYHKVVLVSANPARTEQVRGRRLINVSGDPTDAGTLWAAGLRRADVLYACAELGPANAATALRAREIARAHGRPLVTFARVRDAEICTALQARRIGAEDDLRFRLDFFSAEDIAARVLLDKHLLAPDGREPARVVIVGFGRLGHAVLREIARRQLPGRNPLLSVQIRGASQAAIADFLKVFPVVGRSCSVTGDGNRPQRPARDEPTLILICLPDNDDALIAGLDAVHSLNARSDRVVICMSDPSPFGRVLTGQKALLDDVEGRLTVFEIIEEACVPGRIRQDLTDQLARAIHQAYVNNRVARGDSPQLNKSMRPWEELPEDLRRSNLAQAADIGVKLDAIGCAVIPESASAPDFAFTADEIQRLAQMEHQRWAKERQEQGFVHGPNRQGNQHPDLVDWQYLSEAAKDKDRDAIRELPAILRQAGFQILRLPPRSL